MTSSCPDICRCASKTWATRAALQWWQMTEWCSNDALESWKVSGLGYHMCRHLCSIIQEPGCLSCGCCCGKNWVPQREVLWPVPHVWICSNCHGVFWCKLPWSLLGVLGCAHWLSWRSWGGSWGIRLERRRRLHTSSNIYLLLPSGTMQFPSWEAWAVNVVLELSIVMFCLTCNCSTDM